MDQINYKWKLGEDSVGASEETSAPGSFLTGFQLKTHNVVMSTGNYTRLAVDFSLQRSSGSYILRAYIPCSMIVILGYISFFVKTPCVRMTTCTLALLLMVMGCQHISDMIPKTAYIKVIDLFTGTCMTFVFAAFVGELRKFLKDFLDLKNN